MNFLSYIFYQYTALSSRAVDDVFRRFGRR